MTEETDWRLMGQENWLADRRVGWAEWFSNRPGWDHDHCALCSAEFAATKTDHVDYTAGYVTADDNYTWVCEPCFADFRDRFRCTFVRPER